MRSSRDYPFDKLVLPVGEVRLYQGANPTFHRSRDYGIVVTQQALYWYSPFWFWLSRWQRYALEDIESVRFIDSRWLPKLMIRVGGRNRVMRTPYDSYADEMDYDRKVLREASVLIEKRRGRSQSTLNSLHT